METTRTVQLVPYLDAVRLMTDTLGVPYEDVGEMHLWPGGITLTVCVRDESGRIKKTPDGEFMETQIEIEVAR